MDEQAALASMYADVVRLVNRTANPLHFTFNGKQYYVPVGKKGINIARHIAIHAIIKNPVRVGMGGYVEESLLGIEDSEEWPTTPLDFTEKDIEETPKVEVDMITPEGKQAKAKKISLKPQKESFQENNQ